MAVWGSLVRSFFLYWIGLVLLIWFTWDSDVDHSWPLIVLGITGIYAGGWTRHMRMWPCFILVPRLSQRVFWLAMVFIVATTMAASALTWHAGGSVPPIGPALLIGTYLAYAIARGKVMSMVLSWPIIFLPLFLTVAANWVQFEDFSLLHSLSFTAVQIPAIGIAVIFAAMLRHRLQTPVVQQHFNALQTPFWVVLLTRMAFLTAYSPRIGPTYYMTWSEMAKISIATAAVVLAIDLSNAFAVFGLHGVMFTTVVVIIWPTVMINDGIDFRIAWLTGLGHTRQSLARRVVARIIVAGSLPMLAFVLVAETTRSLVGVGSASLEPLLVAQIAGFGLLALCFSFRGQFPNGPANLLTALLLLASLVIWLRAYQPFLEELQFELGAYAVTALAVTASALAAVFAVGWGLARADHLQ